MGEEIKGNLRKEVKEMEGQVIVALAVALPLVLLPVALVWYINIGGIVAAVKMARAKKTARVLAKAR